MRAHLSKLKFILWATFFTFCGLVALFSSLYLYLAPTLPEAESLRQVQLQTPLRIFSSDGALIGEFGEKRRTPLQFSEIPSDLINAFLAAEDDQFYSHNGVDIGGLLRAVSQLVQSGEIRSGGSTITMQVARNFFLTRQQTFSRKLNEIFLAVQIENALSKQDILELYCNKIYLGNRAYGVEAAAKVYYGKPLKELTLAQQAMIAGLPKAPSAYNPIANPSRALIRRNWILDRMKSLDMIDDNQWKFARNEIDNARFHGSKLDFKAPYISEIARKKTLELFGTSAYEKGYRVYTTVDSELQQTAQQALIKGVMAYDSRHGYRGPEAQLSTPVQEQEQEQEQEQDTISSLTEEQPENSATETPILPPEGWLEALQEFKTVNSLEPAAVVSVNESSATVLLKSGALKTLEWGAGISDIRPYIDENRRGNKPEAANEALSTGDIIRVIVDSEGQLTLSQLPAAEAALIAINPNDGAVKAIAGGFDFDRSHFNRVTQAKRQPGSNFKPFIYSAALEQGYTPASLINDAPIVFNDSKLENTWRPENSSGRFYGPTRLRKALYNSRNLVSIRLLRDLGIGNVTPTLERFGLEPGALPKDLSLALGSYAMTPLSVAQGYAVIANGGYRVESYFIDRIEDIDGNIIYQADPLRVCSVCDTPKPVLDTEQTLPLDDIDSLESALQAQLDSEIETEETIYREAPRVMSEETNYLIDSMLKDVIVKGTARRAKSLNRSDIAGKTGTTNGPTDAWFSGYQRNLVATAWLGFDDNSNLGRREFGGTSALPIWIDFMAKALESIPEYQRPLPDGLASVKIDPQTGKRTSPSDPEGIFEVFPVDQLPEREITENSNGSRQSNDTYLPDELF